MINNKLDNDEVILYESSIQYGKENTDGKLILTNKNLIFYKEKGIFSRKLRADKKVLVNSIKVHKDNVSIKQNNKTITMQTAVGDVTFECKNIFEAGKLVNKIKDVRTDSNVVDRAYKKYNNFKTSDVGKALVGGGLTWMATHPKQTVKGAKKVAKVIKTLFIRGK